MVRAHKVFEVEINGGGAPEARYLQDVSVRFVSSGYKISTATLLGAIDSAVEGGTLEGRVAWHPDSEWLVVGSGDTFVDEHGVEEDDLELLATWVWTDTDLRVEETEEA